MRRKRMINAIRRNKKFTLVLAGVMLTAALCSGCGSSAGETGTGTITEAVTEAVTVTPGGAKTYELPENEIIFLDHYTNGAWGMSNNGFYIRSDGRMYQFDFDTVGFSPSRGMQLMDRLALWEKYFEPVGRVELDFLEELYDTYRKDYSPENALAKLKEVWSYTVGLIEDEKERSRIRKLVIKSKNDSQYRDAVMVARSYL